MKILLLYDTMDRPETELILEMAKQPKVSLEVLCNTSSGFSSLLDSSSIKYRHLVCKSRLDFKAVKAIRERVKTGGFDLLHAFSARMLTSAIIACCGLKDSPKIIAYRGVMGKLPRLDPFSWISYRNSKVVAINCVSDAVKKSLLDLGFEEKKLKTIYKGHKLDWYRGATPASRAHFKIPEKAVLIASVANYRKNKGIDLLVDVFCDLAKNENLHLLLVGELGELESQCQALPDFIKSRIHRLGKRSDVPSLLQMSDLFVLPTRYAEGLPKAVIEAMSLGLPVVVTGVGGVVELVRDGVDGCVVQPNSQDALIAGISRVLSDLDRAKMMGVSAQKRIETDFNLDQTVKNTFSLYSNLLDSSDSQFRP
jgi:L-malate glycosyltransferase